MDGEAPGRCVRRDAGGAVLGRCGAGARCGDDDGARAGSHSRAPAPGPSRAAAPGGRSVRTAAGSGGGELAGEDAVPLVGGQLRVEQRHPRGVLRDGGGPVPGGPQPPVGRRGRGRGLRLDNGQRARRAHRDVVASGAGAPGPPDAAPGVPGPPAPSVGAPGPSDGGRAAGRQADPGQAGVESQASGLLRQMEGGALVAGDQDGLQGLGQTPRPLRRGDVVGQAGGDEVAARRGEAAGVERRALDAALDGGPARPAGLDLQEAGAGVEVAAGADLEAAPALAGGEQVGVQVGGVEVGGGVAEAAAALDLQDAGGAGQGVDESLGGGQGHEVLAVDPDEQARGRVELGESGGGQTARVQAGGASDHGGCSPARMRPDGLSGSRRRRGAPPSDGSAAPSCPRGRRRRGGRRGRRPAPAGRGARAAGSARRRGWCR